ncbi:MAG: glycosyltransferase [candidate division WWE3 bacterium]|nr:glycosyltransferase [candidate division WWE3 bacterium]
MTNPKVALIHDFLIQDGGAEQVLRALHELYPQAPVYTTIFDKRLEASFPSSSWDIRVSSASRIPLIRHIFKYFTLFWPLYFEGLDLSAYDVVISDTANFAKGVITTSKQLHVSYIHTPPRFLYGYETETNKRSNWFWKPILSIVDNYLRVWDYSAAQRPNILLAPSKNTADRIYKFYRRDSIVTYPPSKLLSETIVTSVDNSSIEPYFLCVGRLVRYKNFDLAILACQKLGLSLQIVGSGPELARLKHLAVPTTKFLGRVSDSELAGLYKGCQALLNPVSDEDFGIVPVEALSYGKPVVALTGGGASEVITPGITGELFPEATVASLESVLSNFKSTNYLSEECRKRAAVFSGKDFKNEVFKVVADNWGKNTSRDHQP